MKIPVQSITPQEWQQMSDIPGIVLIDLRSPQEYQKKHIPGAINIPYNMLRKIAPYRRNKIVLYCESGVRSTAAAMYLADRGYRIATLKGGIEAYSKAQTT